MINAALAPYVTDVNYQPTEEDRLLIDSISAHVRKNPKLYASAVREIDHGKYSFESLAADRAEFEAAANADHARAKEAALEAGREVPRNLLEQNPLNPRCAVDWRDTLVQRPELVDLLRINAGRDELLMEWMGWPQSCGGPAPAKRLAISILECQIIFVMTSVLFDPDSDDGEARASLQKVPWDGPPLFGRKTAQRVMAGRGELKLWIEMARRAAQKCGLPLLGEASANSGRPAETPEVVNDGAAARDQDFERIRTRLPRPEVAKRAIDVLTKLRQIGGDWLAACQIERTGLSPKSVHSASVRGDWASSKDVHGHGTAATSYSRDRLIKYVVHQWTPKPPPASPRLAIIHIDDGADPSDAHCDEGH